MGKDALEKDFEEEDSGRSEESIGDDGVQADSDVLAPSQRTQGSGVGVDSDAQRP